MGLRGLIFKRTWRPSPIYTDSSDRLDALARARVRRNEKWYNWGRYIVIGIVVLILIVTLCAMISIYINGDVSTDEWAPNQDSHVVLKVDQPEDERFQSFHTDALVQGESIKPKNRTARTHTDSLAGGTPVENYDSFGLRQERNPIRGQHNPSFNNQPPAGYRPQSSYPTQVRPMYPQRNESVHPSLSGRGRDSYGNPTEVFPSIQSRRDNPHYNPDTHYHDPHYHPEVYPAQYVPPSWPPNYQSPIIPHPPFNHHPVPQPNSPKHGLIIGNYPQPPVPAANYPPQPAVYIPTTDSPTPSVASTPAVPVTAPPTSHPPEEQHSHPASDHDHHSHHNHTTSDSSGTENIQNRHVAKEGYPAADCEFKCTKDQQCISKSLKCDGRCDCNDGSDETDCHCIDRIGNKKHCDGYPDCPDGEDEVGCHGCTKHQFSCKVASENNVKKEAECIDEDRYCDGIRDCSNSRDEKDCFRLKNIKTEVRGILSEGILQKKIGNKWYFICGADESEYMLSAIADKVCDIVVGNLHQEDPLVSYVPGSSPEYATLDYAFMGETDAKFRISNESCPSKKVISIKCPDPVCGYPVSKYETYSISRSSHHSESDEGLHSHRSKKNKYSDDNELQGKVVGGYDSKHGDYPFICAIYRNGTFHCGASIVSSEWIITAGHCTHYHERWTYEVQCGQLRRYSWSPTEQTRMVTEVHSHERYDKRVFLNDIALMKLEHPLYLSKHVATACLADPSMDPVLDQSCTVIGWGDLTEDGTAPDHLQEVELPVKHCKETFTREAVQICAGHDEGGKDACQGDSGGPFICKGSDGRNILNGLVSFGRGCARAGQLGVYTRVSAYLRWINSIITYQNPATEKEDYYSKTCPPGRCLRSGGECIFEKMICDQNVDCLYSEDELSCVYANNVVPSSYELDPGAMEEVKGAKHAHEEHQHESGGVTLCHEDQEFQCKTSKTCVPLYQKCNGKFDCADCTDEKDCDCATVISNAFPEKKCNGIVDCADGSDEEYCDYCHNNPEQVICPLAKNVTCVTKNKWCDGMAHCPFGEDEIDCFRISKDKNEVPSSGFLDDRKSRVATSGYVYIRQGDTSWKPACAEEFGNQMGDLVCPYLSMSLPGSSKHYKRNAPWQIPRPTRKTGQKKKLEGGPCNRTKVTCGDPSCGERRLYSYSSGMTRPSRNAIGAHPWTCVVLVDGRVTCLCTILSKQWVAVSDLCLDKDIKSIKDNYISVRTGPYDPAWLLTNPMEQVKRVNYIENDYNGISFLHLDKSIMFDHFSAPICTNFGDYTDARYVPLEECQRVSLVNSTILYKNVKVLMNECSEDNDHNLCAEVKYKDCLASENAFVYCTTDRTGISSWYFAGFFGSASSKCSQGVNQVELINPFYGPMSEKYQDLISGPAQSIASPPTCDGTRCPYGNCVRKELECDKIPHCSDGQDEARCQGHFQIFRASETEDVYLASHGNNTDATCPVGHFRCDSTYNCVPISAFCDGKCDCGPDDLTDEPEESCDCRHYMELISPERICDDSGYPDCPDRSDEKNCPCKYKSFKCNENYSEDNNNDCIHRNLVCDGNNDCKNGRDESECIALSTKLDVLNMNKTEEQYGGYVLLQVRDQWHPYCSHDWSQELATAICKKELRYRRLVLLNTFDLDEITQQQKVSGRMGNYDAEDDEEDDSEGTPRNVIIWYQDEDLLGEYSSKRYEGNSYDGCTVAFIVCGN